MTYSSDLRKLAFITFPRSGGKVRQTARHVNVSPSTIHRWKSLSSWGVGKDRKTRKRKAWTIEVRDLVGSWCFSTACVTVPQLRAAVMSQLRLRVSESTIRRGLRDLGYMRRRLSGKLLGSPSSEQVKQFTSRFVELATPDTLLISVDESHFSERVLPQYGYLRKGAETPGCRLPDRNGRSGSWTSYSLLHAITSDGRSHSEVITGSVTRDRFTAFVESMPFPAGSVLMMDNCSIHKGIHDVLSRKQYHPLYLSPYSPQFQPVELAFSMIKNTFRLSWPWTQGIREAIESATLSVACKSNQGFFRHAIRNIQSVGNR